MATKIEGASRSNMYTVAPEALYLVKEPGNPLFDKRVLEPVDEALVLNIMAKGVIQPIHVLKDGDMLQVVDGRHRTMAALEANNRLVKEGKEPIKVKILPVSGSDKDIFGVMVSTNELRKDDAMLNKADKAKKMMDMGASLEEVAVSFGVTTKAIRNWLSVSDLADPVREAILSGKIATSAAAELAPLPKKDQVVALKNLLENAGDKKVTIKKAKAQKEEVKPAKKTKAAKEKAERKADKKVVRQVAAIAHAMGELGLEDMDYTIDIKDVLATIHTNRTMPWAERCPLLTAVQLDASDPFTTATRAFEAGMLFARGMQVQRD